MAVRMSLKTLSTVFAASFLAAAALRASSVTSSASTYSWGGCPPGQANSDSNSTSASASCFGPPGPFSTSAVSSYFNSFSSNALTMDLHAFTPLEGGNIYGIGDASWSEDLIVTGGTGSGWLHILFNNSVSPPGGIGGIAGSCEVYFNGLAQNNGCSPPSREVPFTFGTPLTLSLAIHAFAFADGVDPSQGGALDTTLHWQVSLASIGAYAGLDQSSGQIQGAEIQLLPEPAAWTLGIAGCLWIILLLRHRRNRECVIVELCHPCAPSSPNGMFPSEASLGSPKALS